MKTVTLTAAYDTTILNYVPSNNYDSMVWIDSGELASETNRITRCLLKFDVSSIPSSAQVLSATLRLYAIYDDSSNNRIKRVYRVKRAWVSNQATWNVWKTGSNWQVAGCGGADDRETSDIGSLEMSANPTLNTWYSWELTPSKVQEWIDGTFTNNGIALITDTELNDFMQYASKEDANGKYPELVIEYVEGVKTINGIDIAKVKTINGVDINKVKSIWGIQ